MPKSLSYALKVFSTLSTSQSSKKTRRTSFGTSRSTSSWLRCAVLWISGRAWFVSFLPRRFQIAAINSLSLFQCCAQLLISTVYMMYGIYVYSFQGQFTLPLAFQGVSKFSWQTVGNAMALITGIIAAGLYGNIGISKLF